MFRSSNHCDSCDAPTENIQNECGDYQCDDCAERAHDRQQDSLMSGDTPTFRETYLAAYEQKRGLK